jgi:phage baseplate assembly protein W
MRWEPRLSVQRVALTAVDGLRGRFALDITAALAATGDAVALSVPLSSSGAA